MSETKAPAFVSTVEQEEKLQAVIAKYKGTDGALIPVLHEAQSIFGYLPIEVQKMISDGLDVPMAEIYGVVTFYTQFSLNPKGEYKVGVCLGTACYVKGSGDILEKFKELLGHTPLQVFVGMLVGLAVPFLLTLIPAYGIYWPL